MLEQESVGWNVALFGGEVKLIVSRGVPESTEAEQESGLLKSIQSA